MTSREEIGIHFPFVIFHFSFSIRLQPVVAARELKWQMAYVK